MVRAVTVIGADNQIDEIVMRVLLRKHEAIRKQLGISVPVPDSANYVVEAVMEELLGSTPQDDQPVLEGMDELVRTRRADLHREWDSFAERENGRDPGQPGHRPADQGVHPRSPRCLGALGAVQTGRTHRRGLQTVASEADTDGLCPGDGALFLQGWRDGPAAYVIPEDAGPLHQALAVAFGAATEMLP